MMNAILVAVVQFFETVVSYSAGVVLIALAVVGTIVACRWILATRSGEGHYGRAAAVLRKGSGSLPLAAVLAIGLAVGMGAFALWAR